MKHNHIAIVFAFLLLATACNGLSGKKDNPGDQPVDNLSTNVVPQLSQAYYTMDEDQPTIEGEIKDGGLWLTFHKAPILELNITDEDSYRLPDEPIKVEGLQGIPGSFVIADIGQDYNPILCVLTSEGKVQLLNLWNTVATGDIEASEIPMDDIVGFKSAPGGPWEDEDGAIYYEYTTIYGIDSNGGQQEIPLYLLDNDLQYIEKVKGSDVVYQLHLGDAWKMQYVIGYYLSEKVEEMQGHFWPIDEDWDEMIFTFGYELTTDIDYTGSDIKTTEINRTGVFEIQRPNFDVETHVVVPVEGVDFANKGMNVPVPFQPVGAYGG
jgi:hypothetical protein